MKPFDLLLLVIVLLSALRGFGRGLVGMAVGLGGFLVALVVAREFYTPLANYLDTHFGFAKAVQGTLVHAMPVGTLLVPGISQNVAQATNSVVSAIAFLVIMVAAELVLGVIAGRIGQFSNKIPVIGPVNRLAGLVFAAVESTAAIAAVLLLIEPLARTGALGSLSHYVTQAPLSHQLWVLAQRFAPIVEKLP